MIDAKVLRQALDKFLKAPIVQAARMQVMTNDGVFHDIHAIKLLENRIIGSSETHRIVIEVRRGPQASHSSPRTGQHTWAAGVLREG